MRILVGLSIVLLVTACNPAASTIELALTAAERAWCEDGHFGSLLSAAVELGRGEEVIEAHGDLLTALQEQGELAALDAYYSEQVVIGSCRLAYDREMAGRPFVPVREEP